jgi:hypothetical protein
VYTLNLPEIAQFNIADAPRFVDFWSQFYKDSTTVFQATKEGSEHDNSSSAKPGDGQTASTKSRQKKNAAIIDYFSELNVGNDLTDENVRRLLRWKDPTRLTEVIKGRPNAKVVSVLKSVRETLNKVSLSTGI